MVRVQAPNIQGVEVEHLLETIDEVCHIVVTLISINAQDV